MQKNRGAAFELPVPSLECRETCVSRQRSFFVAHYHACTFPLIKDRNIPGGRSP